MKYFSLFLSLLIIGCAGHSDKSLIIENDPITTAAIAVSIDELPKYWQHSIIAKLNNPQSNRDIKKSNCINVAFIIGEDGLVHNPKVIKATTNISKRFHKAAIKTIKQFTFTPADTNADRKPVISNYIFTFFNEYTNLTSRQFEHLNFPR
ncbi:energy transducer TonB [Dasania marina]|uniref:energy transducer TonB n=1 Tax=Dasania marina TaxID=471499 RepID=UPI0030DC3DBC|tara:strand:+ start:105889 stop:106338 length:450 start_codon:yes stop_codon:yes gene_type:complete